MGPGAVEPQTTPPPRDPPAVLPLDLESRHGGIPLTSLSRPTPFHQINNTGQYLFPIPHSPLPLHHVDGIFHPPNTPFHTSSRTLGGMEPQTHTILAGPTHNPLFPKLVPSSPDKPLFTYPAAASRTLRFLTSRAGGWDHNAILLPHDRLSRTTD